MLFDHNRHLFTGVEVLDIIPVFPQAYSWRFSNVEVEQKDSVSELNYIIHVVLILGVFFLILLCVSNQITVSDVGYLFTFCFIVNYL